MIAANLAQKSRSETCALTPAMVADDWLFSSSSSVLCPKPATVSATVGSGIVASTGVERWSKSRDSAVVSATARPGQSHRSRQIGVLPRGQQKDGGRSGLVDLSIAKPPVYENRGLAYQTYSRLNIHASRTIVPLFNLNGAVKGLLSLRLVHEAIPMNALKTTT